MPIVTALTDICAAAGGMLFLDRHGHLHQPTDEFLNDLLASSAAALTSPNLASIVSSRGAERDSENRSPRTQEGRRRDRHIAKIINLGLMYGTGLEKLEEVIPSTDGDEP